MAIVARNFNLECGYSLKPQAVCNHILSYTAIEFLDANAIKNWRTENLQ